jgi:NNP family nitrate/nitrite transporter-like MFS transporter
MERYTAFRGRALTFLLFLWYLWFLNMGARIIFAPILPIIEDEFFISHARASSIFVFLSVGYGISMLGSGVYAGRIGYRKSIVLSLFVSCIVFFLIPFVRNFFLLYLCGFTIGLASGIYLPSVLPLITEYYAERRWGKSIVIHDSAAPTAIFFIPLIVLALLHVVDWRGIFYVFSAAFLAGALVLACIRHDVKIGHAPQGMFGSLIRGRSLWIMTILSVFGAAANLGLYAIIPLYLTKELSMSLEAANSVLGISRLGGIAVAISAGFFIDRLNLVVVLFVILLASGVLTVLTAVASIAWIPFLLFVQAGVVTGFFPVALVVIARMFDRQARGMATGVVLTLSVILGGGLMPYLLGLAGDHITFRYGILMLGIIICLASTLTLRLKEPESSSAVSVAAE